MIIIIRKTKPKGRKIPRVKYGQRGQHVWTTRKRPDRSFLLRHYSCLFSLILVDWTHHTKSERARAYVTWVCAIQWKNNTKTHDRRGRVHSTSQKRLFFFLLVFVFFFFFAPTPPGTHGRCMPRSLSVDFYFKYLNARTQRQDKKDKAKESATALQNRPTDSRCNCAISFFFPWPRRQWEKSQWHTAAWRFSSSFQTAGTTYLFYFFILPTCARRELRVLVVQCSYAMTSITLSPYLRFFPLGGGSGVCVCVYVLSMSHIYIQTNKATTTKTTSLYDCTITPSRIASLTVLSSFTLSQLSYFFFKSFPAQWEDDAILCKYRGLRVRIRNSACLWSI